MVYIEKKFAGYLLVLLVISISCEKGKKEEPEAKACVLNSDCSINQVCDPRSRKCVAKVECREDRDCNEGKICLEGACVSAVPCKIISDCPSGQECQSGRCIPSGMQYCESGVKPQIFYKDSDGDKYSDGTTKLACSAPEGYTSAVTGGRDCNDDDANINPEAAEICDDKDNDCDINVDEGFAPCSAPSSLTYFFISGDTIGLRWQDNSPNEQGFIIQVSTDSSFSSPQTQQFSQNTTDGYITFLLDGTTYWFRVYAFNSYGRTDFSNTFLVKTSSIYFEGATQISLGCSHTCAVKTDNTLWCWSRNWYGQIGDGTTEGKQRPVKITDGISQVYLGMHHTCTVKTDNTLWCWGANWDGQLGDGTAWKEYPVRVKSGGGGGEAPILYHTYYFTTPPLLQHTITDVLQLATDGVTQYTVSVLFLFLLLYIYCLGVARADITKEYFYL